MRLALLLVLVSQLSGVPVVGPGEAVVDPEQPGRIDGTVRDPASGAAVPQAGLALYRPTLAADRRYPEPWVAEGAGDRGAPLARTVADGQGRFAFLGLSPGRYEVRTTDSHASSGSAAAVLSRETPQREVVVEVEVGATARGTVVDAAGDPIAGFAVLLVGHDVGDGVNAMSSGGRGVRARTGDDGRFELRPLPSGVLYVQAGQEDFGFGSPVRLDASSGDVFEGLVLEVPDEREELARRRGNEGGVGVRLDFEPAGPRVRGLIDGMPARDAGVLPGDRIVELDGRPTRFMSPAEFIHRCRGRAGEAVVLGVQTGDGPPREVVLTRRAFPGERR